MSTLSCAQTKNPRSASAVLLAPPTRLIRWRVFAGARERNFVGEVRSAEAIRSANFVAGDVTFVRCHNAVQ